MNIPYPTTSIEELLANAHEGLWLMLWLLVPTLLLEAWSYETSRALYKKNAQLYWQALALNLINHFGLGAPGYALVVTLLSDRDRVSVREVAGQVLGLILVHSICFYQVHQTFHTVKSLYQWHKFHHLFNTHVSPITANAVSVVEYVIAYLSPFAVGMLLFPCSVTSLKIAIQVISFLNLAMHTPKLEQFYQTLFPAWIPLVHTAAHLEHHKRLNCHYAAPTLDWDGIVLLVTQALHLEKQTENLAEPVQTLTDPQ